MRNATELMVQYAAYHRDPRNIATHFVGVPLIIFGVAVLLGRPTFEIAGLPLTPAWLLWGVAALWYLTRGNLLLGLTVSFANAVLAALASQVADDGTASWLAWGIGTFLVGWAIQFLGHYYEGRKPAFVDDLTGLAMGPMFVAGEGLFAMGFCLPLMREIEKRVGPPVLRDLAHPVG